MVKFSIRGHYYLPCVLFSNSMQMMQRFFIIVCFFIAQALSAQCKLTVAEIGKKCDLMKELKLPDHEDSKPQKINDTTVEFTLQLNEPEYLFVLLDTAHTGKLRNMWIIRTWVAPDINHRELVINHATKTFKINDGSKRISNYLHEWDSVVQIVFQLENDSKLDEGQKMITAYIDNHPDSYLSLWLFGTHEIDVEPSEQKSALFNKLNPGLNKYRDYHLSKANLTDRNYPNQGDAFKEFTLTDINGNAFNSATIKNKWILLHFWSTTCGPCINEMDHMVSYYKTLDTSKIAFISVGLDPDITKWKKNQTTHKIKWTNLWEPDNFYGDLCLQYNLQAMPFFVLFNSEKKLLIMQDGADALDTTIKGYLSKVK